MVLLSVEAPQLLLVNLSKSEVVVGCGIALLKLLLKGLAELLGQQQKTVVKPMRTRGLFFVRHLHQ
jgi:hypothetical protein